MKYTLISLFILAVLGGASAQSSEFIGVGLKAEFGRAADFYATGDNIALYSSVVFEAQAGDYNLFGPFGFRQVLGTDFDYLELSSDVLIPLLERPTIYLGAGAGLSVGEGTIYHVRGVVGAELRPFPHLGVFGEVNPGYAVVSGQEDRFGPDGDSGFGVKVRLGFNVHP